MADNEIISGTDWKRMVREVPLPPRQLEIAQQIMQGRSDKQIAEHLGVKLPTVRTHLGRIYARLRIQNRSQLILFLIRKARLTEDDHRR